MVQPAFFLARWTRKFLNCIPDLLGDQRLMVILNFEISTLADPQICFVPEEAMPGIVSSVQLALGCVADFLIGFALSAHLPGDLHVFTKDWIRFPLAHDAYGAIALLSDDHFGG